LNKLSVIKGTENLKQVTKYVSSTQEAHISLADLHSTTTFFFSKDAKL